MIMDAQNRPSNNQSLAGTGTIVSTDSIDLLTSAANLGRSGTQIRAIALLSAALAGATAVQAQLIESNNANLSSPRVLASGDEVAVANAIAGAELLDVPVPDTTRRYLGFQYVLTGTATGGTVTSGLVGGTDRRVNEIPMNTGL